MAGYLNQDVGPTPILPSSLPQTDVAPGNETQQETALAQTRRPDIQRPNLGAPPGPMSRMLGPGDPIARIVEGPTCQDRLGGVISFLKAASSGMAEAYTPPAYRRQTPGHPAAGSRGATWEITESM